MRIFQLRRFYVGLLWVGLLVLGSSACNGPQQADTATSPAPAEVYRPAQDLGGLFHQVQMGRVFDDSKTFVDMLAMHPPSQILSEYQSQRKKADFALDAFVARHFSAPPVPPDVRGQVATHPDMWTRIDQLWTQLRRPADTHPPEFSSLLPLPHPYIVPGGRFREIYYWDSYFTMQGLVRSERGALARDMVNNFAWLLERTGRIPNGNRSYYLSRSQPPFFAAMVTLLSERGLLQPGAFQTELLQEYQFWMAGSTALAPGEASMRAVRMPDGALLNRYYDDLARPRPESYREDVHTAAELPGDRRDGLYRNIRAAAESGWDFSSRWMGEDQRLASLRTIDIVPVDLNALLYHLERTISRQSRALGELEVAQEFARKAQERKRAINRWLWDPKRNLYGDWLYKEETFTGVESLAMVYPLYFAIANSEQAEDIAAALASKFLHAGGLVTTLSDTGEQWDSPNGWAPLQWLAVKGLARYGHESLALQITERWLSLNQKVYGDTGRMMEKYNVVDITLEAGGGEYPTQDGFGWTNGVAVALKGWLQDQQ